jgi:hypothetical protein
LQESWEESDEEEDKKPAQPSGPAPPVRRKGITKQKIAEKEAEEALKRADLEARVRIALRFFKNFLGGSLSLTFARLNLTRYYRGYNKKRRLKRQTLLLERSVNRLSNSRPTWRTLEVSLAMLQ